MGVEERSADLMQTLKWLALHVPGFQDGLPSREMRVIRDFLFLWSLYEARVLDTNASHGAITVSVEALIGSAYFSIRSFEPSINHFRKRYFDGERLTPAFDALRIRNREQRELVERVVSGVSDSDTEILSALFFIIYRLRNNSFHGVKWNYNLIGQYNNFHYSNRALMLILEGHETKLL